jgi:hypothetical protein
MSAPNPFSIAVQGLRPGGSTLEIGSQGLILTITPIPEEDEQDIGLFPIRYYGPADTRPYDSRRKDCLIHVTGCRATLTTTGDNIAAKAPTNAELDERMEIAEAEQIIREIELEERLYAEAQYQIRWDSVMRRWEEHQKEKSKRRAFRKDVCTLAKQIKTGSDSTEDLAALIVLLKNEVGELATRLHQLQKEQPKAKTRRKR